MNFGDFVGNSEVIGRLSTMLSQSRLPHAIIIEGAPGSGRRTLAKMIARAAVCTGDNPPCGRCSCCRAEQAPDISFVLPEKSIIKVDAIRDVRENAYIKPTQSNKRVFIIPDAPLMNPQAQNALLKVLEEPPEAAMFIMTCEYTRQLLGTVVSRSAVFSLTPPERGEAVQYIAAHYPKYSQSEVEAVCDGGTIGEALSKLSGERGYMADAERLASLLGGSELELHLAMRSYERDRTAQKGIAEAMLRIMHDAFTIRSGGVARCPEGDVRHSLARQFTAEQLLALCDACRRASKDCEANMGSLLFITCFSAALCATIED